MIEAGLRVDVDTFRGTRDGVPKLLRILDKHDIRASFFFSVGPDNMGRHVWRLFKPRFLRKMLRSQAASLYGWDILLAGTLWPGRRIGKRLAQTFRETDRCGHEIGLHAWDHHAWQARAGHWGPAQLERQIRLGMDGLSDILGRRVDCSATAGWRTIQSVVDAKESFGFRYNSDCRGTSIFRPTLADGSPGTPQIPVSLPTFDEVIGCDSGAVHFNDFILDRFHSEQFNVYTVHAEVEGGIQVGSFDDLLKRARARGIYFRALGELLPDDVNKLPSGRIVPGQVMGREGWIGTQACG